MYEFNAVKAIPTPDNQVNQIAWKDNKLVLFLSTVFTGADDERVVRQRKKPSSKKSEAKPIRLFFSNEAVKMINIPTVAAAYNDEMNHVDRGDQLRPYYKYDHALRRGPWQALAWTFLLDVALVNSYIVQLHGQPNWKRYTNHRAWRECIYNELFNAYGYDSQARKHYRAGDERDLQSLQLQREQPMATHGIATRNRADAGVQARHHNLSKVSKRTPTNTREVHKSSAASGFSILD
ncbi:hypothetical protein Focb16_v015453 [Fusarium oxysporum f. sp. cubense]|uniref:PiggyBac transposable element-derived protein domain-containing protein n=1 Tax=Fusarium oxysporum f. sp. cubense TaxID=61366 RepID=A0A559KYT7_FUSOC|nr:hypothetical protein Focb16_v015453 [Fusarium oxysporum f. sp. cubense]